MPTIKEVAALAKVSIGTVSHVLAGSCNVSDELRARVVEAVRTLGYRPNHIARSLKSRQTRTLGMVISDITNPFFPEIVRGAEDAALARGYLLTTFNTDDNPERERRVFEILRMRQMDGMLVVVALKRGRHSHLVDAIAEGIGVVCLDRIPQGLQVDAVTVDNAGGVRMAVEHLIAGGYRRIAYLGGSSRMYIAPERLRGYLEAMATARRKPIALEGDFRPESGYRLAKSLLQRKPRPDALMMGNMLMAAGALRAMEELGLEAPRDLGLATFDSITLLDAFRPHLTRVSQPSYRIGFEGAQLLMDRLEKRITGTAVRHIELPCELLPGDSTVRPVPD